MKAQFSKRITLVFSIILAFGLAGIGFAFSVGTPVLLKHSVRASENLPPAVPKPAQQKTPTSPWIPEDLPRNSQDGRFIYGYDALKKRPALQAQAVGSSILINEAVQTFDVLAPPPAFTPTTPSGTLTATNTGPVWSPDEKYLFFSANLDTNDNLSHIWVVSANGGPPVQVTTGPGNEYFPAINANGNALAFVSDAQSPGVTNLYAISYTTGQAAVDVSALNSLTLRNDGLYTGLTNVGRPTWSPGGDAIAFAGRSMGKFESSPNHWHIYYLYASSGGYLPLGSGSGANPPAKLTDGLADDTDPAWSPDGKYIAFATTAASVSNNGNVAITPLNAPIRTTAPTGTSRTIWLISGSFQFVAFPPHQVTLGTKDDFAPAWSNPAVASTRGGIYQGDIAFARGQNRASNHDIYLLDVLGNLGANPIEVTSGVTALNTGDPSNIYDDSYPTWSPLATIGSIAYQSNRTISYNDSTGSPTELAVSVKPGSNAPGIGIVGPNYVGILESELYSVDPPTLLRWDGNEVVHITDPSGNTVRYLQSGIPVKISVRLSDREAGNDDGNIYVQIKDPDSKYQDANGLEHKLFARDFQYYQTYQPGQVSGSQQRLYNGGVYYSTTFQVPSGISIPELYRGAAAGVDGTAPIMVGVDPAKTVNRVKDVNVHTNQTNGQIFVIQQTSDNKTFDVSPNPDLFIPSGQEYECQFVNPKFAGPDTSTDPDPLTNPDYGTPYYVPGIDDQTPGRPPRPTEWLKLTKSAKQDNLGGVQYSVTWTTPTSQSDYYLDVIAYDKTASANWRIYDNVWGFTTQPFNSSNDILLVNDYALGQKFALSTFGGPSGLLNLLPTLYGSESYFSDIDTSLLPNATYFWGPAKGLATSFANDFDAVPGKNITGLVAVPGDTAVFLNWAPLDDGKQGTKYALFRGTKSKGEDAVPIAFGLTKPHYIDRNLTPGTTYFYIVKVEGPFTGTPPPPSPALSYTEDSNEASATPGVPVDIGEPAAQVRAISQPTLYGLPVPGTVLGLNNLVQNGLGVQSFIPDASIRLQYTQWRILSRGPVPDSVLASYAPQFETQPAVIDNGINAPAASVPSAKRCVIWLSPFTGHLLTGDGTLDSPVTQDQLARFSLAGGRLFVDGPVVASQLTANGTINNTPTDFLGSVLNATWGSYGGGSQNLVGSTSAGSRITNDSLLGAGTVLNGVSNFSKITSIKDFEDGSSGSYSPPGSSPLLLGNNYLEVQDGGLALWRTDGSLDQLGPHSTAFKQNLFLGEIDTILPVGTAHSDIAFAPPGNIGSGFGTYTGGTGLVYNENATTGARSVFSSAGLEGIGLEFYKVTSTNRDHYLTNNQRPKLLFNIVNYLRTGTFTGTIRDTSLKGGGVGVPNATVYVLPNGGFNIPGNTSTRQLYSTTTDFKGNYTVDGLEPGTYLVFVYKVGYTRGRSISSRTINGDESATVNLNISQTPQGSITGKVTNSLGQPVSGAAVTFTSTADSTVVVTGTTGPDGSYTIQNVPSAVSPGVAYLGTATQGGLVSTYQSIAVLQGQTTANVDFKLVNPGTVGGLVQDSAGAAISGATVTITDSKSQVVATFSTNAVTSPASPSGDGKPLNYAVALAPGTYTVTASKLGLATASKSVTVTAGKFTRYDPVLTVPPGTLGGLISDATLAPVTGVTITVLDSLGATVATTTTAASTSPPAPNGDGTPLNFTLPLLPGTYTVQASKLGSLTATGTVTITSAAFTRIDLTVTPGTLGGLVTDSSGQPVSGATVTITDAGGTVLPAITTGAPTSPAAPAGDGKSLNYIADLGPGTYTIQASTKTLVSVPKSVTVTATSFVRQDISLVLPGTLGGLVTDPNGSPVAGATITVTDKTSGAIVASTTSGVPTTPAVSPTSDGGKLNYTLALAPGSYNVTASKSGFISVSMSTVIVSNTFTRQDLSMTLPAGTIGGLVQNSANQDLTGVSITITDKNGVPVGVVTTGANTSPASPNGDGSPLNYTVSLAGGPYTLMLSKQGYTTLVVPGVIVNSRVFTRYDLKLVPAPATIDGVTQDYSSTLIPGATITVTDSNNVTVATLTSGAKTKIGPGGYPINYSVTLPAGTYTISSVKAGYLPLSMSVTVKPGQLRNLNLIAHAYGTVGGLITDPTGAGVSGASITLTDMNSNVFSGSSTPGASSPTAPGGDGQPLNYTVSAPAGTYTLAVSSAGLTTYTATVIVTSGAFTRQDVALTYPGGTLGGLVQNQNGTGVDGASVAITNSSGALVASLTTRLVSPVPVAPKGDGNPINFASDLAPGTYTVTVTDKGYSTTSQTVVVTTGAFIRVNPTIIQQPGTVGGLVTDSKGQPLAGVTVTVTTVAGATVASVVTGAVSSPSAPAGDGSSQNYSVSLPVGTYVVLFAKPGYEPGSAQVTVSSLQFSRQGLKMFLSPVNYTLPAGLNFFSTPLDFSGISLDALLGSLQTTSGGIRSHLAIWQPQSLQYALDPTPPADSVHLGLGYWLRLSAPRQITVTGSSPASASIPVSLFPFWNMVGVPSLTPINVSDLQFANPVAGGPALTFAQATGASYKLISPTLYRYDGASNSYQSVTATDALQPWQAYWIKSYANTTLLLPTNR